MYENSNIHHINDTYVVLEVTDEAVFNFLGELTESISSDDFRFKVFSEISIAEDFSGVLL